MPDKSHARMEIEERRTRIDVIDRQLVALLNERAGHSLAIRKLKPLLDMQVFDPAREDEIMEKVASYSDKTLYDQGLREIYATILKVMKENPARTDDADEEE